MAEREPDAAADRYTERVAQIVLERLGDPTRTELEDKVRELVEPLLRLVVSEAARIALELLEEDGFCSFPFHVSETGEDAWRADGTCCHCGEPRSGHESVLICDVSEAAEQIRHNLQRRDRDG